MIRLSTPNDINGIITVWRDAFGDKEKDIRFFLEGHYKPENAVVCELDGIIASVLFLIEGDMHIKGCDYPSYYLYAACTLKVFRGRGLMASLLDYAKKIASERNKYFIALKPAEESLYNYYSKFGYKSVFTKKISFIKIYNTALNETHSNNNLCKSYSEIRDNLFSDLDYFKWSNDALSFAVEHHKYYGGYIAKDCNGYLLYSADNDVLCVKENCFPPEILLANLQKISQETNSNIVQIETPNSFTFDSNEYEVVNSGMLLPLCSEAENITETLKNAYLALTLD